MTPTRATQMSIKIPSDGIIIHHNRRMSIYSSNMQHILTHAILLKQKMEFLMLEMWFSNFVMLMNSMCQTEIFLDMKETYWQKKWIPCPRRFDSRIKCLALGKISIIFCLSSRRFFMKGLYLNYRTFSLEKFESADTGIGKKTRHHNLTNANTTWNRQKTHVAVSSGIFFSS